MSEVSTNTYLGLPVPTPEEAVLFYPVTNPEGVDVSFFPYSLAAKVLRFNNRYNEVIERDIESWLNSETDNCSPRPEDFPIIQYSEGVRNGYKFIIGLVVGLIFLRSDYAETGQLDKFLADDLFISQIPRISGRVLQQHLKVVSGEAEIGEESRNRMIFSSSDIPTIDANDYYDLSDDLGELLDNEVRTRYKLLKNAHPESDPNCLGIIQASQDGFHHGASNAVELFLLAEEDRLFGEFFGRIHGQYLQAITFLN